MYTLVREEVTIATAARLLSVANDNVTLCFISRLTTGNIYQFFLDL